MSSALKFDTSAIRDIAFARVGNKLKGEEILVADTLSEIAGEHEELLTEALMKRFKNLERQVFYDKEDLALNPVYAACKSLFGLEANLLEEAKNITQHYFDSVSDIKIKAGDICVVSIEDVDLGGALCKGLCIVKSEAAVPVLEIAEEENGEIGLKAKNVISPDKLQSGVLIVDYQEKSGFAVYAFDKSRDESSFWKRGFLGVKPYLDEDFLTKKYAEMAVSFAQEDLQDDELDEADRFELASKAMSYFEENDDFNLERFERTAFSDNEEMKSQFQEFKKHFKDDEGVPLEGNFSITRPVAQKACKRVKGVMNFDNGASLSFKSQFAENIQESLEKGYDEQRQMKFVKIYYNEEL